MQHFFDDEGMQFETLIALGQTHHGMADVGEVLTTVAGIAPTAEQAVNRAA